MIDDIQEVRELVESLRREWDVSQARICKAIAALEAGSIEDALRSLRGEGLCTLYRCASLQGCYRLLERWQRRWDHLRRADPVIDGDLYTDTDAMLLGKRMPSSCPGCMKALAIACPTCGRKHLEAP